jgi:pantothenate kinase-related protein Tda10
LLEDILDDLNKRRLDTTADWIRNDVLLSSWIERGFPVLYFSGIPGSGKSFIASKIVTILQEIHPQGFHIPSHVSVGYFFFKDSDPEKRSFHQALRDISFQIR